MATKTDFTEEEWDAMQRGVTGAGMYVSLADRDFTDSFGEANALAKYLGVQHQQSESMLVRDLAGTHRSGFGFRTSPSELESGTLTALRSASAIVAAKAPDESDAYRQLVLGVAEHVAEAKGGKTPAEDAAIAKISEALSAA
jgi:hypothetical protein